MYFTRGNFVPSLKLAALPLKQQPVTQRKFKYEVLRYCRENKIEFSNDNYGILYIKGVKVDYRDDLEVCHLLVPNTHQGSHSPMIVCVPYISASNLIQKIQTYKVKLERSKLRFSAATWDAKNNREFSSYETFLRLKNKSLDNG
jgi:hypothetical protein